jgi:hypothetical protein
MIRWIIRILLMPPFVCFWASNQTNKGFIPLRHLRSDQQTGYTSSLILMSSMEGRSEENFLHEIWAWNVESKGSAAAMDDEKIALKYR